MSPTITPFLWFNDDAIAAKDFYLEVFDDAEEISTMGDPAKPLGATLRVHDLTFTLFNGGPHKKLDEALSLFVMVETQDEIDRYWDALQADGGRPSQCGWLEDKFGVSWQVCPALMMDYLSKQGGPEDEAAQRAFQAMLGMTKFDIAGLQAAYEGG